MRYLTGLAAVATIVAIASAANMAARAQTTDQSAPSATVPAASPPAVPPATETPSPATVPPAPAPPVAGPPMAMPAAATPQAVTPPVPPPPNGTPATVMDLGEVDGVLGKNVRSTAGDDMGRIVDVMVGGNGQVHAAIIDFGGFLGVGSRKVAVDWRALQFASEGKVGRITTGLSRNQIRLAPEYKNGEAVVVLNAPGVAPPVAAATVASPAAVPAAAPPVVVVPAAAPPAASPPGTAAPAPAPTAEDASAQRPKPAP